MRTSDVLMDVKLLILASVLVVSGTAAAQAQQGQFFFQFSFFGKPVPPADIPDVAEGPAAPAPSPLAAPGMDVGAPVAPPDPETALALVPNANTDTADMAPAPTLASIEPLPDSAEDSAFKALEVAADAGQPIALWRLGTMYESGEGVQKDEVRAFGYFSRIANENANTPPRSLEADIVAQSFVKVGEYYRDGLPDAGIPADSARSAALLMHAATYFADAEAQYEVGRLYLDGEGIGQSALQGARWLSLAARKGNVPAQATLGDLLFNGDGDTLQAQPIEGLMWLSIAHNRAEGTVDADWVDELLNKAMSIATPDQRSAALQAAETLGPRIGGG
jgi:uncharacterized protein